MITMCAISTMGRPHRTPQKEARMSKRPQNTHLHGDPAALNIRDPEQKGDELSRQPTPPHKDHAQHDHPEQPEKK